MKSLYILLGLVISSLFAGCTAPRPYTQFERMTFTTECGRYSVDEAHNACLEEHREMRTSCYLICGGFEVCYDRCDDAWDGDTCGEPNRACLANNYRFALAAHPDAELGAACRAFTASLDACGRGFGVPDACATFERTERREATAVYQCLADLDCDADTSVCGPPVPPMGLAEHFCELALPGGYECTPDLITWLEATDGWLRDDVVERLDDCQPAAGEDRVRCLNAWLSAITP